MKKMLALVLFAAMGFAPTAWANSWQDALYSDVHAGYFGGYSEQDLVSLAAQHPVDDDTLGLHQRFIATWANAQVQDESIEIGSFIIQTKLYYSDLHAQYGDDGSPDSVRTRCTTGGF